MLGLVSQLLRKNTSPARIAGFAVSNLIGLAIMAAGLQFYLDARSIWTQKDNFLKSDYLAINKIIDASNTIGNASADFSSEDIAELEAQPWVEKVGTFTKADFRVYAGVGIDTSPGAGDAVEENVETPKRRRLSTAMFFEAVPDEFLDIEESGFHWDKDSQEVPIIISKDYLALYNFGFAGAAGLPRLSENLISGLPLQLTLTSESGVKRRQMYGRIAGYSNRFNTILVPYSFIEHMNAELSDAPGNEATSPSRLIVDVNSPGDAAIAPYLKEHGWEVAGDKSRSSAAYMLRVVSGIVIAIGSVITLLSLFILILSISLLMEKNRRKLHSLLMLGYPIKDIARPYWRLTAIMSGGAALMALLCVIALRSYYLAPLRALGAEGSSILWSAAMIAVLTTFIIVINGRAIMRRVLQAWR